MTLISARNIETVFLDLEIDTICSSDDTFVVVVVVVYLPPHHVPDKRQDIRDGLVFK